MLEKRVDLRSSAWGSAAFLGARAVAASAAAGPTNPGFETGDSSGWSTSGNAAVATGGAAAGQYYGQIWSGGSNPGVESTLSQTVALTAGQTLSGSANFLGRDACGYDDGGRTRTG